jgi:hypothetical protein
MFRATTPEENPFVPPPAARGIPRLPAQRRSHSVRLCYKNWPFVSSSPMGEEEVR